MESLNLVYFYFVYKNKGDHSQILIPLNDYIHHDTIDSFNDESVHVYKMVGHWVSISLIVIE